MTIHAGRFDGFVWFPDYWNAFYVNLDSKAAAAMELKPGQLLSVTCEAAGICIKTRLLENHAPFVDDGKTTPMMYMMARMAAEQQARAKCPAPRGEEEHAYARIEGLSDWAGKEFLFSKRSETKVGIESKHLKTWLPVAVEIESPAKYPSSEIRSRTETAEAPGSQAAGASRCNAGHKTTKTL